MSYEIPRSEGEGCFCQEQSSDYTVAVFKQTMNKTLHAIPLNVSVVSVSFSTPSTRKLNDACSAVHRELIFVAWSFSFFLNR